MPADPPTPADAPLHGAPSSAPPEIRTLGALRASGYRPRSVKDEVRANLIRKLRAGEDVFPGILGYDRTVIPQVQNALLGRHDLILLGLRGQAKSRLVRLLPTLLDEWVPVVEGADIPDDPLAPVSKFARTLVAEAGDETPVGWLHRSLRYGEKLATPDTSIADLIGDIDPIKAATRRLTYADEEVIHFGLIPRTHRGIFAINELPDLQARIQVGLLNILEEQDVQIRGFNIRIPLDVLMVFTANPEDYTNRGSIITPLKDRIDSQILTHYPRELATSVEITRQEAWQDRGPDGVRVHVPHVFREIVEQIAFEARKSEYVDQKSGVSARLTRAALEDLISAAERRALLHGEPETTVRPSDLVHTEPAVTGKVELVYEGEQEGAQGVARALVGKAVQAIAARYLPDPADKARGRPAYADVLAWFARGHTLDLSTELAFDDYAAALARVDGLGKLVDTHAPGGDAAERASMMELALELLHQHSLLGKDVEADGSRFSDLMGSVLAGLSPPSDDDDLDDDDAYGRRR
ncbi:MAG: magnesium chelatase [Rubricoccaceae bacterium]